MSGCFLQGLGLEIRLYHVWAAHLFECNLGEEEQEGINRPFHCGRVEWNPPKLTRYSRHLDRLRVWRWFLLYGLASTIQSVRGFPSSKLICPALRN